MLNNGNIVVAYEKETTDGANTFSMANEIYTNTGAPVLGQFIFNSVGTQNKAQMLLHCKTVGSPSPTRTMGMGLANLESRWLFLPPPER